VFLRFSLLLVVLSSLLACSQAYTNLDNKELKTLLAEGVPIIDVRRPDEWRKTGVIEGSKLLTFVDGQGKVAPDFLNRFTQTIAKDQPVILICRTGNRTSQLSKYLAEKMGYTKIYNVKNGITRWIRDGQPVSRVGG